MEVALGNSNLNLPDDTGRFAVPLPNTLNDSLVANKGEDVEIWKKIVVLRKNAYVLRVQRVLDVRKFATKDRLCNSEKAGNA